MEAGQIDFDGDVENKTGASCTLAAPTTPPAQAEHFGSSPKFDPTQTSSAKTKIKGTNQDLHEKITPPAPSVSKCYVFKSRLQELCQKQGIISPVYETTKEGPSHEPFFRSTVIVNNVRYDSLPGFFNRKAAEQSAAEVALIEMAKSTDLNFGISQPVHETGLSKNLLQEYAQKMNYAIPLYESRKEEKDDRTTMYSCVVEIGGIKYIGASASTKKEAEIKAARTALIAIQTAGPASEDHTSNSSLYTVVPERRKVPEPNASSQEVKAELKPKKGRFKKQHWKKRRGMAKVKSNGDGSGASATGAASSDVNMDGQGGEGIGPTNTLGSQGKNSGGSDIHAEAQGQESRGTNSIHSQGVESGLNGTTNGACTIYNRNLENDGGSTIMNVN